ncbi:hypothetical protein BHE90_000571 [Fusarium euwallaceae]|uniref:Uncharacterized protein n=1 Tax=Fusarium euwallaceae TaxID=1147111 RepID=A0A430M9Y6_9HYPO|nr:hypothetical protein BHE90_000571 [Fusarium euwallaceae]
MADDIFGDIIGDKKDRDEAANTWIYHLTSAMTTPPLMIPMPQPPFKAGLGPIGIRNLGLGLSLRA